MDKHRQRRRWLVRAIIIAALGPCMLPALDAADSDAQEVSAGANNPSTSIDNASDEESGSKLVPPADAMDTPASSGSESDAGENSGLGLKVPEKATEELVPEGDLSGEELVREELAWEDSVPPADSEFDWVQLISGEWLKGEFKTLYEYKLAFKSDKLKDLELDWFDVRQLRTAGLKAVRIQPPAPGSQPFTAYGVVTMVDEVVTIGRGDDARTVARRNVVSIVNAGQTEIDYWSGYLTAGANVRTGNSDVTDLTLTARLERRRAISRFLANYVGTFSRAEGVETSNNHRLDASFDALRSTKYYWRVVFAQYLRDTFRNIENQLSVGTGVGYLAIRNPKTTWDLDAGVGVFYQKFVSVEVGRPEEKSSPVLYLGTRYEDEVTSWLDFVFDYALQVVDEDNGGLISHTIVSLETDLTNKLELELAWYWNYIHKPQPTADGTVPLRDDNRFVIGLSYDF